MTIHDMRYTDTIDGTMIFICPICGRRAFWIPGKKPIFDHGDPTAAHRGGVGGMTVGVREVAQDDPIFARFVDGLDMNEL